MSRASFPQRPGLLPWPAGGHKDISRLRQIMLVGLALALQSVSAAQVPASGDSAGPEAIRVLRETAIPEAPPPADNSIQSELNRLGWSVHGHGQTSAESARAAWLLGLIYLHGAGVPRDLSLAEDWFRRAAELGEPWAHAGLAWCSMDGCQAPADLAAAERHVALLRKKHPARADYFTWLLVERQPARASSAHQGQRNPAALLQVAAAAGDSQALLELGIQAASRNEQAQATALFRRAGSQSQSAVHNLSVLGAPAISPRRPYPDARSPAENIYRAARKNHRGDGVPANFSEAIRLYRLAASKGNREARRMLELIYSHPSPSGGVDIAWMLQLAGVDPSPIAAGVEVRPTAPQLQRDPTPLFDLLPHQWQKRVRLVSP